MATQEDVDKFKSCMAIQVNLDTEVFTVILFDPLRDFSAWWTRQSTKTLALVGSVFAFAQGAVTRLIARAVGLTVEAAGEVVLALAAAVAAGISLGTFMLEVGNCIAQM